ncbi:MAG: hypothetical protein NDI61_07420 [Bdellovibrionaceae bacterium]|nr:hypothetical protein [Pseudobdellovibrionaceae bacterium]
MKTLLFAVITMLSLPAVAGSRNMEHNYLPALRGIAIENACLTDSEVRTINPISRCTKLEERTVHAGDYSYTDYVCVAHVVSHVAYPRVFQRRGCAEFRTIRHGDADYQECVRASATMEELPDVIQVNVITSQGDTDNWPGRARSFRFPRCD